MIRCSICGSPTTNSYAFRTSRFGVRPATYACKSCGGAPNCSEIGRLAEVLDHMNRWKVTLSSKQAETCRSEVYDPVKGRGNLKNAKNEHDRGAELAVSVLCDMELRRYTPQPCPGMPNVGDDIQVRRSLDPNGSLVVSQKEPFPDHFYVFATGRLPDFRVVGWIQGQRAMQIGHFQHGARAGEGFWVISQEDLLRMEHLPHFKGNPPEKYATQGDLRRSLTQRRIDTTEKNWQQLKNSVDG